MEEEDVATASVAVIHTLNTVEAVALSLLSNIPGNETTSISISSPSITLVAEKYIIPVEDDIDTLIIPDVSALKDRNIEEKIQIPISVARSLAKNNTNFMVS